MTDHFFQSARLGRLTTALGPDVLVLMRFEGEERLNGLFDFDVDCLATSADLDFDKLLGTQASVTLSNRKSKRQFDGIVTEARWLGAGENGLRYRLRLQPWFWLAGLRRNQRIFHNRTVVQILEELLADYADAGRLVVETESDYPKLEYTVQFRESDLDFACRMMERHGISYHFRHHDGGHDMVLTDAAAAHATIGDREFHPDEGHHWIEDGHFWSWQPARRITTGAIRLTDYNFKKPHARMEVDRIGDAAHPQGRIESFDWPGDYLDLDRGKVVAALRGQSERGQDCRFEAEGDVLSLSAGARMTLAGEPVPGTGATYLCLVATHSYTSDNYGSGGQQGEEMAYRGRYVLMPDTAPMVPERKTPRADVRGPQTAVVVGAKGEEIDCDEYGRILLRFHWDLEGAWSMRCRVSQNWSGNGWGGMIIPRIGMEVVVEFLDGDPDQPLVTGCVYNGRNSPPYSLPEGKTKSVFKTDTHKGSGFNELTFDDDKDNELIYMHGQKNQQIEILNDRSKTIGRDETNGIGRDRIQTVGQDETMSVGRDQREAVARDVVYNVGRNQQESYGKDHVHVVGNIHKQDIFADHLLQIGRNFEGAVSGKYTLDVTNSITTNTATHTLMAFGKFVIKGPAGKITLDAAGITLEAPLIQLKGMVKMGGSGSSQVPTLQGAANDALPLVEECVKQTTDE
ncbi:type VI secretion system Vgr family protein [Tabrizicola aquatica]|uniref:type VI secretion system Vgr family protein n=1 Tax=Tabrizicola aquatica TaxID=909926 RepID=UPI000CD05B3A|nr:type VI secretion system tip protein TssI/VgrG [Tabrizicola aquatica]